MEKHRKIIKLLMKIRKGFPQSQAVYFINMLLKILPNFILTHDWSIKSQGISWYLFQLTLGPLIYQYFPKPVTSFLVLLLFLILVVNGMIFIKAYNQLTKYDKLFPRMKMYLLVSSKIIFYLGFMFNQHVLTLFTENFLCDGGIFETKGDRFSTITDYDESSLSGVQCRGGLNTAIMLIQSALLVYYAIISYLFTVLCSEPFFTSTKSIVANLNSCNWQWIVMPMAQGLIQLELHIPFSYMVYFKCAFRAFFICVFINHVLHLGKRFYISYHMFYFKNFLFAMCFASCIIEYFCLITNDIGLLVLQQSGIVIILKLFIEISLSAVILKIVSCFETRYLCDFINTTSQDSMLYEFLNKYFYIIYNADKEYHSTVFKKMMQNLIETFTEHFQFAKCTKIPEIKCFCEKYKVTDITFQTNSFLSKAILNSTVRSVKRSTVLKIYFPMLFDFLEYFCKTNLEKNKNTGQYGIFLLISALFYHVFDNNYNKSMLYLEEFTKTLYYKNSFVLQIQIHQYKNLITEMSQSSQCLHENLYSDLKKFIYAEKRIQNALQCYGDLLAKFNEVEITFEEFFKQLHSLGDCLSTNEKIFNNYENTQSISSLSYSNCVKLFMYYKFFFRKVPCMLNDFIKSMANYDDVIYQHIKPTMIFSSFCANGKEYLKVEYASDDLCSELGYNADEIVHLNIFSLFPKSLQALYLHLLQRKIAKGKFTVNVDEMCFLDKEGYAKLFDFYGFVVVKNSLKIYAEIKSNENFHSKKEFKKKHKFHFKESCFIFTKKTGKIIAISKEFQKYFFLSLKIIKQLRVNFFNDILKIEHCTQKEIIKKDLKEIYDSIAQLNLSQIFESANDEFSKNYKIITDTKNKLRCRNSRNAQVVCNFYEKTFQSSKGNRVKQYFLIVFSIELDNFFKTKVETFIKSFQEEDLPQVMSSATEKIQIGQKELSDITLTEDIVDINLKVNLIRQLSLAILSSVYSMKKEEIVPTISDQEDTECKQNTQKKYSESSLRVVVGDYNEMDIVKERQTRPSRTKQGSVNYYYQTLKTNTKICKRINLQFISWIVGMAIFICASIGISMQSTELYDTDNTIFRSYYFLTQCRSIMSSAMGAVLGLQLQANRIQDGAIDNGFRNDKMYHRTNLNNSIKDYLNYLRIFHSYYEQNEQSEFTRKIESVFQGEHEYIALGIDNKRSVKKSSLLENVYYFHLLANKLLYDDIDVVYYNTSSISTVVPVITSATHRASTESAYFLIENYLTAIRYPFDEVLNLYLESLGNHSRTALLVLIWMDVGRSAFLVLFFAVQAMVYNRINNIIFAKFYITFNYLRYFHLLLSVKMTVLNDIMSNYRLEKLKVLRKTEISIINKVEETKMLGVIKNNLENPAELTLKAFSVAIKNGDLCKEFCNRFDTSGRVCIVQSKAKDGTEIKASIFNPFAHEQMEEYPSHKNTIQGSKLISNRKIVDRLKDRVKYHPSNININIPTKGLTSTSTTNRTVDNLIKGNGELDIGKKQLYRPTSFFFKLLIFGIVSISIVAMSMTSSQISWMKFTLHIQLHQLAKFVYGRIWHINEMILIYQLSLLKNEEIVYSYSSHGYLNSTAAFGHLNTLNLHNVFQEASERYSYYAEGVANMTNGNTESILSTLVEYEKKIETSEFCEYYPKFFVDNIGYLEYPAFASLINSTVEELTLQCKNIGKGLNSKGLSSAINDMFYQIQGMYRDFKTSSNRTEDYIYKKLNDPLLLSYQTEMNALLDKISMNYLICARIDYFKKYDTLNIYEQLFIYGIFLAIILLGVVESWNFSYRFWGEDNLIGLTEDCIYNTIIF